MTFGGCALFHARGHHRHELHAPDCRRRSRSRRGRREGGVDGAVGDGIFALVGGLIGAAGRPGSAPPFAAGVARGPQQSGPSAASAGEVVAREAGDRGPA